MNEQERWQMILDLDEELLQGGVMLSEWSVFLVRDADTAFASGANLAAIITALAAVESHLKYKCGNSSRERLVKLIDKVGIEEDLQKDLHRLRKYRNKWVHIDDPHKDELLLSNPEQYEMELEDMAFLAVRSLRRVLYYQQCV
ncbi:MAG: hypothetical protein AAFR24_20990 [Cyanobacteria bacterium J06627_3]